MANKYCFIPYILHILAILSKTLCGVCTMLPFRATHVAG